MLCGSSLLWFMVLANPTVRRAENDPSLSSFLPPTFPADAGRSMQSRLPHLLCADEEQPYPDAKDEAEDAASHSEEHRTNLPAFLLFARCGGLHRGLYL